MQNYKGLLFILCLSFLYSDSIDKLYIEDEIRLNGNTGTDALIQKSASNGRDELMIYAGGDAYKTNSNGAGIKLYGNNDSQHNGIIAFLTGADEQGDARMIISERGNITIGSWLWNFVDEGKDDHLVNIVYKGKLVAYITKYGRYVYLGN